MQDSAGRYIFVPITSHGPTGAVLLQLLGYPVNVTDTASVLGKVGDVILVEAAQIVGIMRKDVTLDRSQDAYFDTFEVGFRIMSRFGCGPMGVGQTTPRNNEAPQPWCVCLSQ